MVHFQTGNNGKPLLSRLGSGGTKAGGVAPRPDMARDNESDLQLRLITGFTYKYTLLHQSL
jgi:hypothetical protein